MRARAKAALVGVPGLSGAPNALSRAQLVTVALAESLGVPQRVFLDDTLGAVSDGEAMRLLGALEARWERSLDAAGRPVYTATGALPTKATTAKPGTQIRVARVDEIRRQIRGAGAALRASRDCVDLLGESFLELIEQAEIGLEALARGIAAELDGPTLRELLERLVLPEGESPSADLADLLDPVAPNAADRGLISALAHAAETVLVPMSRSRAQEEAALAIIDAASRLCVLRSAVAPPRAPISDLLGVVVECQSCVADAIDGFRDAAEEVGLSDCDLREVSLDGGATLRLDDELVFLAQEWEDLRRTAEIAGPMARASAARRAAALATRARVLRGPTPDAFRALGLHEDDATHVAARLHRVSARIEQCAGRVTDATRPVGAGGVFGSSPGLRASVEQTAAAAPPADATGAAPSPKPGSASDGKSAKAARRRDPTISNTAPIEDQTDIPRA